MYESVAKLPCGEVTVAKLPCGEVTVAKLPCGEVTGNRNTVAYLHSTTSSTLAHQCEGNVSLSKYRPPVSKHSTSNNLIISKLALLQVFYALYWPVNGRKNCFVRFTF